MLGKDKSTGEISAIKILKKEVILAKVGIDVLICPFRLICRAVCLQHSTVLLFIDNSFRLLNGNNYAVVFTPCMLPHCVPASHSVLRKRMWMASTQQPVSPSLIVTSVLLPCSWAERLMERGWVSPCPPKWRRKASSFESCFILAQTMGTISFPPSPNQLLCHMHF